MINPILKKTILAICLFGSFCIFGLTSCDKVKDTLFPAFEWQVQEVPVTIPVTIAGVESSSSTTIAFNLDSAIKAYTSNAFSISNLNSVKVKDLTVSLENADQANNVSNFETVSLKFASNTVSTPAIVASKAIPDSYATDVNITATDSPELKEYLKGSQLTYTISGKARRSTIKPLNATVSVTLAIK